MLKFILIPLFFAVCFSQNVDFNQICSFITKVDCSTFANKTLCATDHKTYRSECDFSKSHCVEKDLHISHYGECKIQTVRPLVGGVTASYLFFCTNLHHSHCGTDVEMVCGSDDNTYFNFCLFEKARCLNSSLTIGSYQGCV